MLKDRQKAEGFNQQVNETVSSNHRTDDNVIQKWNAVIKLPKIQNYLR